ncbi:MAG: DinB family protein, partial [Calditrichaeota bacterium]
MNRMIQPIIKHFQFTDFIMNLVLADLKNEDAIKRIRNGEGCSISWIVGHLITYRYRIMKLMGHEEENELESLFGDGPATDGSNYPSIDRMLERWNMQAEEFYPIMEKVTDEYLLSPMPSKDGAHNEKTILDTVSFFEWHESSHLGAIGLI